MLLASCTIYPKISNRNLTYLYQFGKGAEQPLSHIYHFSEDSSTVFLKINLANLCTESQVFKEPIKLIFKAWQYSSYQSKTPIDSFYAERFLSKSDLSKKINFQFTVKSNYNPSGILLLEFGLNQNAMRTKSLLEFDRKNFYDSHFYTLENATTHEKILNPFLNARDSMVLKTQFPDLIDSVFISKLNEQVDIALPPFYEEAESKVALNYTFRLQKTAAIQAQINIPESGIYAVNHTLDKRNGFLVYRFYDGFPEIINYDYMLSPLRYITRQAEYDSFDANSNTRNAVEKFWLSISPSKAAARQLIHEYYKRVQYANQYFTSVAEGWKTDRGMIYIVFGKPVQLFKTATDEKWVYAFGAENLTFEFYKVNLPFTSQHFLLKRNYLFEKYWYKTVNDWRSGRIPTTSF